MSDPRTVKGIGWDGDDLHLVLDDPEEHVVLVGAQITSMTFGKQEEPGS